MLFAVCILVLALQACASSSAPFSFSLSPVAQCAPISFSFSGSLDTNAIPTTISLIPSNAQVLRIDIPHGLNFSNGLGVSFFPLPENTTFLVSLDRSATSVAPISDFLKVDPSNDTSCLETATLASPDIFHFSQNLSSSQPFSISYNSSLVSGAPTIRLYQPDRFPTPIAANCSVAGNAIYILPAMSGNFILSVEANSTLQQTSAVQSSALTMRSTKSISVRIAIGVSIGIAVTVLIGISIAVFAVKERRRAKNVMSVILMNETRDKPLPQLPTDSASTHTPIPNPTYVTAQTQDVTPFDSWNQSNLGAQHTSLQAGSLDIERMLDRASTDFTSIPRPYQNHDDPETSPQFSFLSLTELDSGEDTVSPTAARWYRSPFSLPPLRRHSPLDVPKDLTPVRQSFNSSSIARSSLANRILNLTSLPFEGLDDRPPSSLREGQPNK
ncbi:hypothetical protein APHAL10511_002276 [Amanita phalloides]|nr:hypothetical protein APHAL10511_002276 [Amanita phalloides]